MVVAAVEFGGWGVVVDVVGVAVAVDVGVAGVVVGVGVGVAGAVVVAAAGWQKFGGAVEARMIRASSLPVAQYCGASVQYQGAAQRSAAMSTAFHARMAGSPNHDGLLALLSDAERDEVLSWKRPADVVLEDALLRYEEAEKEIAVGLDCFGFYSPHGTEGNLVDGHPDMAWLSGNVVYVGDIKKTVWTTGDGPESLQLHAYGWALASKFGVAYVTGLWLAEDGEWLWAKEPVVMGSPRAERIWERIYHTATQDSSEYSMGAHCKNCYGRLQCPAYALPAVTKDTWLDIEYPRTMTPEQNAVFVSKLLAAEELIERAKQNLKEMVRRGEVRVRDPKTGKIWAPVEQKGKESCSVADLRAKMGEEAEKYIRRGAPFDRFQWVKP